MTVRRFPPGFVWGAATAAYQIEGAVEADGRAPSIWDVFSQQPGAVLNADTGRVAADHYRRFRDDVQIMSELGLPAYRFSVAWSRVVPRGSGAPNPAALQFYDRLVDALLEAGIEPYLTLYHWDLPADLEDKGGWPARDTAFRFAEFTVAVAQRLGDRVKHWTTLNEPWCAAFLGYAAGIHAPGRRDPAAAFTAVHHLLLAHGLAVQALRAQVAAAEVSLVLNQTAVRPASEGAADRAAAEKIDALTTRLFVEPLVEGCYPESVLRLASRFTDWRFVEQGDLRQISQPIDLLGVNYYAPTVVRAAADGRAAVTAGSVPTTAYPGCEDVEFMTPDAPQTGMGWPIDPCGLTEVLGRLHAAAPGLPLLVTENGAAFPDPEPSPHGKVHDPGRRDYLRSHVVAAHEALTDGVDVRGYFVWSLLDNFEWTYGYSQRFGLVHVDFTTQRRVLKDSALWLRDVIRHNAVTSDAGQEDEEQ